MHTFRSRGGQDFAYAELSLPLKKRQGKDLLSLFVDLFNKEVRLGEIS